MAQLITVRLTRNDGQPWGFRLQGGKDFGSPLALQKVNVGSIADKAGLLAGDALIKVNNDELFNLRHKDAQDSLVRAGNSFDLTVSRGGSTWKPSVTPLTSPIPSGGVNVVTKTSLQAKPGQSPAAIGTGHNTAARPFNSNGAPVKSIVNKQYNTPVAMYSDETIAETLSAQTEVLAGGVLGVNFKKNEKVYNSAQSEVFKMLQEQGHEPEPAHNYYWTASHAVGCRAKERSSTPSFVEKFEKKFACTPSASPYFTGGGGGGGLKTPEPSSVAMQQEPPQHPTSADVPKNIEINRPPIQTTTNIKHVVNKDSKTTTTTTTTNNEQTTDNDNEKAPSSTISSALSAHAFNGSSAPVPTTAQLPSSISGPKPFSYAAPAPPAPVSAPKSPIAYPPPAAPAWTAPVNAPVSTGTPTWNPNESLKAPAAQTLQESQPIVVTAAPVEKQNEEVVVEEEKPAPKTEEGGISGKPYNVQNVTQPKRGRGILNQAAAGRSPMCGCCGGQVRGPFITALGRIWCPEHFICVNANCKRPLADIGFVEEKGDLYCEYCFEQYLAPNCSKCTKKIKGDCLNAIGKQFHPECFTCSHCGKLFGNSPFFLEEGEPFCQNDWNQLFTTKCFACGFPVEAGDRWVEALNNNYHSQCFNCTMCKKNLEGQSFYAKGGRPFCKNHAR